MRKGIVAIAAVILSILLYRKLNICYSDTTVGGIGGLQAIPQGVRGEYTSEEKEQLRPPEGSIDPYGPRPFEKGRGGQDSARGDSRVPILVSARGDSASVGQVIADNYKGEKVLYVIYPLGGTAEYTDLGLVDLQGRKARLVTLKTHVLGFDDTEKIYSEPENFLALRVERDVRGWFGKENIIEEYDQKNFTVTIHKFKGRKKVNEQTIKADGPIYNAVILPLYPRTICALDIGWSGAFRVPKKFEVKLVSLETIRVLGRTYQAYHFTSTPDKFEIWINKDEPRVPLKIKGKGGFGYTLLMKEYGQNKTGQD